MSLCRSCTREISPDEQVVQYVKVGACTASVMVCVWCFGGRWRSEPIAPAQPERRGYAPTDAIGDARAAKAEEKQRERDLQVLSDASEDLAKMEEQP